jgi:hypothetical protein
VTELELLNNLGVNSNIFEQYQILCLPENIEKQSEHLELVDASESIILCKLLKEEGVKCANSYDLGLDAKISERRGLDIWLGSVWILNHAALPLLLSVVGRLLGEKIQKELESSKQQKLSQLPGNPDETRVHINLKIMDEKASSEITFHGDADTFLRILKGINNQDEIDEIKD